MTALSSTPIRNITQNEHNAYTWTLEQNPLTPFYKRDQMEKAKYLEWITTNVREQVDLGIMDERTGENGKLNYNLSHLVKIGGQFSNCKNAKDAVLQIQNSEAGRPSFSANLDQVPFSELLREITTDWKRQHRIEIGPFFNHVFPRLRPDKPTKSNPTLYLPHIWRQKAMINDKLVDNGSSIGNYRIPSILLRKSLNHHIAIQLTERNYENIANATGEMQNQLEVDMMESEEQAAPMLREELQGTRTVPPSQVAGLPAGGPIRNRRRDFDINDLEIRPTNWEEQREAIRYQYDCAGEIEHQRRMNEKEKESQIRINERKLAHQEHLATLKHKHETAIAIFDHKQEFRINQSTRSQSRPRGPQAAVVVPAKMLIHPDWDVKNPATVIQAMAICIDHFFESSSSATEAVTLGTFHDILIRVLTKNTLDFDSLCGESPVGSGSHYWREKDNINIAKEVISMAKTQFPKSFVKEVRGAWDSQTRDITCNKKMSMRYVRVRLDRIRELFSAFMQ